MDNLTDVMVGDMVRLSRGDEWFVCQVTEISIRGSHSGPDFLGPIDYVSGILLIWAPCYRWTVGKRVTVYPTKHLTDWDVEILEKGPGP